jgi:hypothetical protein
LKFQNSKQSQISRDYLVIVFLWFSSIKRQPSNVLTKVHALTWPAGPDNSPEKSISYEILTPYPNNKKAPDPVLWPVSTSESFLTCLMGFGPKKSFIIADVPS